MSNEKQINTLLKIKEMTKHLDITQTATCDNNVLAVVVIGKKSFKNAEEFKDYADDAMHDFLDNIQELNGYTYPADGDSLFEYEEGITFYYTKKGSELVHRWIKRMEAIFDKYFPDDYGFQPKCCYWKVF